MRYIKVLLITAAALAALAAPASAGHTPVNGGGTDGHTPVNSAPVGTDGHTPVN